MHVCEMGASITSSRDHLFKDNKASVWSLDGSLSCSEFEVLMSWFDVFVLCRFYSRYTDKIHLPLVQPASCFLR